MDTPNGSFAGTATASVKGDAAQDGAGKERETRLAAEDYADGILEHLEVNLGKFLTAVQRGREQLAQGSQERTGGATAGYDVTT